MVQLLLKALPKSCFSAWPCLWAIFLLLEVALRINVNVGWFGDRKQEELVQQVRKRLEEALMADMLAHVEEIARDGEAPTEKEGGEEEGEDEEEEEEQDHDQEMENV